MHYYHGDHLGSLDRASKGTDGAVEQVERYYPFGQSRGHSGPGNHAYRFTGKELEASGLYYYGARYYDPLIGRFISADSIVPSPGDPQSLNRYSYCYNNPLAYSDPSGHIPIWLAALGFMALGAGAGASIAAISGGDVGMGALTGAISAGAFFGAGQAIVALGLVTQAGAYVSTGAMFAASGIHVGTGAAVGAINAAITGGDVEMGAVTGGISAGMGKFLGGYIPHLGNEVADFGVQLAGHSVIGGVTGGITAELYGGDFGQGFGQGAWTAGFGFAFNQMSPRLMSLLNRGVMFVERAGNRAWQWLSGTGGSAASRAAAPLEVRLPAATRITPELSKGSPFTKQEIEAFVELESMGLGAIERGSARPSVPI